MSECCLCVGKIELVEEHIWSCILVAVQEADDSDRKIVAHRGHDDSDLKIVAH